MTLAVLGTALSACASPQRTPAPSAEPVTFSAAPVAATPAPPAKTLPVPDTLALTQEARDAVQTLGNAAEFGGWAVGYGGEPLPPVRALRTLLSEPQAADALDVVIEHGTLAGQLMAVSGMYFADHARFEQRLASYRTMRATVPVRANGCLVHAEPTIVAELVQAPGSMAYLGPSDTLEAWSKRNPGTRTLVFDIAGGSYPHELRGR